MINTGQLAGRTVFITGASRGIGKSIALKAAKDGANVVIASKTNKPHLRLPGTIYSVAKEIEEIGAQCLPCVVDVRSDSQAKAAVEAAVREFGGIDILVNNAGAFHFANAVDTEMNHYDLMHNICTRGAFLMSKLCIPLLKKSSNAQILNMSPPLLMHPRWFKNHLAHTMAKYGMSMCVMGLAEELKNDNISVNALWSKTPIATTSMELLSEPDTLQNCRNPEIMADAAYAIMTQSPSKTGQFYIDEQVLKEQGISDFTQYAVDPYQPLASNVFLPDEELESLPLNTQDIIQVSNISNSVESIAGSIEDRFVKVKTILDEDFVSRASGVYLFRIQNVEELWYFDLNSNTAIIGRGKHPNMKPDVTIILDLESFNDLFDGFINPTKAFLSGKVKLKGNIDAAMNFEKIMNEVLIKL